MSPRKSSALAAIEALVCRDVGRKTQALIDASRGELGAAAMALGEATSVGLITGFYVPRDDIARRGDRRPGRHGACWRRRLRRAACRRGSPSIHPCADAVRAAVEETGIDVRRGRRRRPRDRAGIARVAAPWRDGRRSHAVAIERCGPSPDGRPRNMRGVDVSPWTAPLDDLFTAAPWVRIGVGDRRQRDRHGPAAGRPDRAHGSEWRADRLRHRLRSPLRRGRVELGSPDGLMAARCRCAAYARSPALVDASLPGTGPRRRRAPSSRKLGASTASRRGTSADGRRLSGGTSMARLVKPEVCVALHGWRTPVAAMANPHAPTHPRSATPFARSA